MKRRLPNRDFAPDKLYLHRYGTLDKTIVQSKTMITLVKFMLGTKSSDDKWKKERDSIVKYWEICTEIVRERKEQGRMTVSAWNNKQKMKAKELKGND